MIILACLAIPLGLFAAFMWRDAMSEIVDFPGITRLDIPTDRILSRALEAGLTEVVVIGCTEDGEEWFSSSIASGPEALWHLERAKLGLLRTVDPE
jgi:hypothetical protein